MDTEKITNTQDLLRLIRDNKNPLQHGNTQSDLMCFIDSFNSLSKDSTEYNKILKLARELANYLDELEYEDFSSLVTFFILTRINDYQTYLTYENAKTGITDIKKQAHYLKLLESINRDGFSKLQLNEFIAIKSTFPLFWADLTFDLNINESIETLKRSGLSFDKMVILIKKWRKAITINDSISFAKLRALVAFIETYDNTSKIWLQKNEDFMSQDQIVTYPFSMGENALLNSYSKKLVRSNSVPEELWTNN